MKVQLQMADGKGDAGADPVAGALQLLAEGEYHQAHLLLAGEFHRNPRLGEIANLIEPCGMIGEARQALLVLRGRRAVEEIGQTCKV